MHLGGAVPLVYPHFHLVAHMQQLLFEGMYLNFVGESFCTYSSSVVSVSA